MNELKLKELLTDEDFAKKILAMEEPQDVQQAFRNEGLELSIQEIKIMGKAFASAAEGKELSEEDLDSVAGGTAVVFGVITGAVCIADLACCLSDSIAGSDWWKRW